MDIKPRYGQIYLRPKEAICRTARTMPTMDWIPRSAGSYDNEVYLCGRLVGGFEIYMTYLYGIVIETPSG